MEKFNKNTLNDILLFLKEKGIKASIKKEEVDSGSTIFVHDYIKLKNGDKDIVIKPWTGGHKQNFIHCDRVDKPDWYKMQIVDASYETNIFHITTGKKMPKDCWYSTKGKTEFVYSFKELEENILKNFLGLESEASHD